jgi:tryptophan synthase beta chain
MHAHLFRSGRGEFISITDDEAMKAGLEVSQLEGIIPAIETSHAFAIFRHRKFNPGDIVVVNLSGRGDKDLQTYINYFNLK